MDREHNEERSDYFAEQGLREPSNVVSADGVNIRAVAESLSVC